MIGFKQRIAALLPFLLPLSLPAMAAEIMPPAQQNALVQKYCTVCHTDEARSGGLTLQRFDVEQAPPSLNAMLLSKLTGGVLLSTATEASSSKTAAALVEKKMKTGAMGAAGIPRPDKSTTEALVQALAVKSTGATNWSLERTPAPLTSAPMLFASILRELPSAPNPGEAKAYRLIVSCNLKSGDGHIQVAWSPIPQRGPLAASTDGRPSIPFPIEASKRPTVIDPPGLASRMLSDAKAGEHLSGLPFPAKSLTITELFPGETVTFSFDDLPSAARDELKACFTM